MRVNRLSANLIKIIAFICMALDHIGYMLFPNEPWLRALGRIAFPLFAYFIAEGCKFTRNKLKHFTLIFCLGVVFEIVYTFVVKGNEPFNIFLTFSLSIMLIYCLDLVKDAIIQKKRIILCILIFFVALSAVIVLCFTLAFDYGIFGVLLPVFVSIPNFRNENAPNLAKRLDNHYIKVLLLILGLFLLPLFNPFGIFLYWGFLSIQILLLYNCKRGKLNLKYFFYLAYPVHIVIIYFISLI